MVRLPSTIRVKTRHIADFVHPGSSDPGVSGLESAPDPAAYRASVAALRGLQPNRVMFGHDLAVVRS